MALRVPAPDGTKAADGLPVMVLPSATELAAGYRLEFLAVGGMSVVYRAQGVRQGKAPILFAKEVPSSASKEVVALVQEKSILERLRHPGIVAVHELFEEDGYYYLLTDFIDGESLDRLISPFPGVFLQEKVVLGWGSELCDIFAYLHRQEPPIIYRDLKPRNVMKDRAGRLHLVDFGIARYHKEGKSKDTESLGTAATASPEHYLGQTDQRSDIFTLGATLHFLLSNGSRKRKAPFEFPPIRSLNSQVSPRAEALLERCLQIDPKQRFSSMEELREALDRCLGRPQPVSYVRAGEPTPYQAEDASLVTAPLQESPPAPSGRSRTPLWVGLALFLGLGGGMLLAYRPAPQVSQQPWSPPTSEPTESVLPTRPVSVAQPTVAPSTVASRPVSSGRPRPSVRPAPVAVPRPRATPAPVAVARPPVPISTGPAYPVHRPTPRPEPSVSIAQPPPAEAPSMARGDRFLFAPWLFPARPDRLPPRGSPGPGGTWVEADDFRILVPTGFDQVPRPSRDLLFLRGERRDTVVVRLRWRESGAADPELMAERFVQENPPVAGGRMRRLTVRGQPAVLWEAEFPFMGTALRVRTQTVLWREGERPYLVCASGWTAKYPEAEMRRVLDSLSGR